MGWLFDGGSDKQEYVNELIRDESWQNSDGQTIVKKVLDHALVNNELWILATYTVGDNAPKKVLYVYLLSKSEGRWGSKGIEASCHPYYYSCPKRLIKPVKDDLKKTEMGKAWIDAWQARKDKKKGLKDIKENLKVGDCFQTGSGHVVLVHFFQKGVPCGSVVKAPENAITKEGPEVYRWAWKCFDKVVDKNLYVKTTQVIPSP